MSDRPSSSWTSAVAVIVTVLVSVISATVVVTERLTRVEERVNQALVQVVEVPRLSQDLARLDERVGFLEGRP